MGKYFDAIKNIDNAKTTGSVMSLYLLVAKDLGVKVTYAARTTYPQHWASAGNAG